METIVHSMNIHEDTYHTLSPWLGLILWGCIRKILHFHEQMDAYIFPSHYISLTNMKIFYGYLLTAAENSWSVYSFIKSYPKALRNYGLNRCNMFLQRQALKFQVQYSWPCSERSSGTQGILVLSLSLSWIQKGLYRLCMNVWLIHIYM